MKRIVLDAYDSGSDYLRRGRSMKRHLVADDGKKRLISLVLFRSICFVNLIFVTYYVWNCIIQKLNSPSSS